VIVGYLLAGFLIGPGFPYFPHVIEADGIRLWGEIGVLFLLFGLGLEFSFKKLISMGPSAIVAASIEVIGLVALGTWVSSQLGFSPKVSFFFGAMVAISSTTILIRAFEETGNRTARFAHNVFGILIVEDLFAVILLVLLSTISVKSDVLGAPTGVEAVLGTLFKFGFFLVVVFVVGVSILPGLIRRIQRVLSDEMRLVLALGLCFMTVVLASSLGFSPTLGAFVMGSLFAGTVEVKRIERLLLPVQQLFGAVFFISVGMQIQHTALVQYPVEALALLAVVLLGKFFFVSLGSLISGKPLKPALRSGISMAQIGEFSFIMIALGISRGVLDSDMGSLIVMIATITAITTPYAVKHSKGIALAIDSRLPKAWREGLDRYSATIQRGGREPEWQAMIRRQTLILMVNSALVGAIALFFEKKANAWISGRFGWTFGTRAGAMMLAVGISAPFFWGIAVGGVRRARIREFWINRQLRPVILFFIVLRAAAFIFFTGFIVSRFFRIPLIGVFSGAIGGAGILFFSKNIERVYERFAERFMVSLSESERKEADLVRQSSEKALLGPWEGHIAMFDVSYDSPAAGKTFEELKIRETFGVTVTLIERGERRIPVPNRSQRIYPLDRLHAIGTDEELAKFREFIETSVSTPASSDEVMPDSDYSLSSVQVLGGSAFAGKTIRDCKIRATANALVVGIERSGKRILNPGADFLIEEDDLLWIVGENQKVRSLYGKRIE
jgi:CPA2 family monovalent cation:H+ antiporter-2